MNPRRRIITILLHILILLGMALSQPQSANIPNPCHQDCNPFMCHGPTKLNCLSCSGNLMLQGNQCICKPGWFTLTTPCDTYIPNCSEIQIFNGVTSCVACQSKRDTLLNGVCSRNIDIPFFIRSSAASFTASTVDTADIDYFYQNRCMSLDSLGKCLECYPDSTLTVDKTCVRRNTYCDAFDINDRCIVAAPSTFVQKQSPLTIGYCYGRCKTCTGSGYYDCQSCHIGSYFSQTPNQLTGTCLFCHSSCKSCTGPTALDCTIGYPGTFVDRQNSTTAQQVLNCPCNCQDCNSASNCTRCSSTKISNNGICSSTANNIIRCQYQYNTPTGNSCFKYNQNYLTGTDFKAYKTSMAQTSIASNCRYASTNYPDRVTAVCEECMSITNQQLDSGFCRPISYSTVPYCDQYTGGTLPLLFCSRCLISKVVATDKTCQDSCNSNEAMITISGYGYCTTCPAGCSSCSFEVNKLVCNGCQTTPVPYIPYKDFCSSTMCGDGVISLNKECDPGSPNQLPNTCTSDCLIIDPAECQGTTCVRKVFEIYGAGINSLVMRVRARYTDFVEFDMNTDLVYDSSNPSSQLFFCSLIFTEIKDNQAICSFDKLNQLITISASSDLMTAFTAKTVTVINTASLIPKRRSLSVLAFSIDSNVSVSVQSSLVKKGVLVTTASIWSVTEDLKLTYSLTEQTLSVTLVEWTITSCSTGGVEDVNKKAQLNTALASSSSTLSNSLLIDDLLLTEQVTVTYSDGTTQIATKQTQISSLPHKLTLIGSSTINFGLGKDVSILFSHSIPSIDLTLITVTLNGVALTSADFKVTNHPETSRIMISFAPQDLSSYEVAVDYSQVGSSSLPSILTFIQVNQPIYANFIVPSTFGANQPISFWTSVGQEYTYSAFVYSKTINSKLLSVPPTISTFENSFPSTLTTIEDLLLFIILKKGISLSSVFKFEVSLASLNSVQESNIPIKSTYRDGSCLQSSKDNIQTGVCRENHILNLPYSTTSHRVLQSVSGAQGEVLLTENLTNLKNKIEISPSLSSQTSDGTITTDYKYSYISEAGSSMTFVTKMNFYNEMTNSLSINQIPINDNTKASFEIATSSEKSFNLFNSFDPTQFDYNLKLFYSPPLNSSQNVLPVVIPTFSRYGVLTFPSLAFPSNTSLHPKAKISTFDQNVFKDTTSIPFTLDTSWSGTLLPVTSYLTEQINQRGIETGTTLFKTMNLHTFIVNQAYFQCSMAKQCLSDNEALQSSRTDLVNSFKSFWDGVTDKEAYKTWDSSVLKSSFINGISVDPKGLKDDQIDILESEISRELPLIFSQVNSSISGLSRTSYQIVESLKPITTVTQLNVDLLISSTSHLMYLFTNSYSKFNSSAQLNTQLNIEYNRIINLNELRLLRYCHVSDTITFQNEVITLGGSTLTSPLRDSYVFNFGSDSAIELKNIQFDKSLPSYELSVLTFSNQYYDDLNSTLGKLNVTAESLNKSRTVVGFSNGFEPVALKNDSTTQINIYRSQAECRGTPCDVNKKLNYGQEIILCECIKPTDTNKFADNFKRMAEETGEVVTETGCQLGKTIVAILYISPEESAKNYKVFMSSAAIIFICFTAFLFAGQFYESKLIDPLANKIFSKLSTIVCISMIMSQPPTTNSESTCLSGGSSPNSPNSPKSLNSDGSKSTSSCEIKDEDEYKKLSPQQSQKMNELKKKLEEDGKPTKDLATSDLKPLSNVKLFGIVYLTHHYVLAIFTSSSTAYSRKTMIMLVYLRTVYGLSLTMFMAMGMNKNGFSSYQSFVLKCLVAPMFISGALMILKKLLKHEKNLGVSILNWCPKKASVPSMQPSTSSISNKVAPKQLTKSPTDRSTEALSHESPRTADKEIHKSDSKNATKADIFSKASSSATSKITSSIAKKSWDVAMVAVGYAVSFGMVPVCASVIASVTQATNASQTWPFGYWFILQITYEMTLGQVLPSLAQLGMLKAYQAKMDGKTGVLALIGRFNPFLNTDVAALNKMSERCR